jgi:hypothetical protein
MSKVFTILFLSFLVVHLSQAASTGEKLREREKICTTDFEVGITQEQFIQKVQAAQKANKAPISKVSQLIKVFKAYDLNLDMMLDTYELSLSAKEKACPGTCEKDTQCGVHCHCHRNRGLCAANGT